MRRAKIDDSLPVIPSLPAPSGPVPVTPAATPTTRLSLPSPSPLSPLPPPTVHTSWARLRWVVLLRPRRNTQDAATIMLPVERARTYRYIIQPATVCYLNRDN